MLLPRPGSNSASTQGIDTTLSTKQGEERSIELPSGFRVTSGARDCTQWIDGGAESEGVLPLSLLAIRGPVVTVDNIVLRGWVQPAASLPGINCPVVG